MDELLSEKEQIEMMRSWWRENGRYVIAGIVLGVGLIVGFNQWKSSVANTQVEASNQFEALADEVAENRLESAEAIAEDLYANYGDTIYADQARLAMARLYMDQGRDEDAAGVLRDMLENGDDSEMQLVGRLRLAKVLLYQDKPADVLSLLDGHTDNAFAPRFGEVVGDANVALGNYDAAEAAYLAALADPRAASLLDRSLVQMKINDLPEALPEGAAAPGEAAAPAAESADDAAAAESAAQEEASE